jgi:hypothetical protein
MEATTSLLGQVEKNSELVDAESSPSPTGMMEEGTTPVNSHGKVQPGKPLHAVLSRMCVQLPGLELFVAGCLSGAKRRDGASRKGSVDRRTNARREMVVWGRHKSRSLYPHQRRRPDEIKICGKRISTKPAIMTGGKLEMKKMGGKKEKKTLHTRPR